MWNICRCSTRFCPWPLLFIIYINDIADKLISLSRLFADDTSFGYSNQDTMQLKKCYCSWFEWNDIWSKNGLCHLILTKQKSWFSLIVAFQGILISLLMENQCPLPLLINTSVLHLAMMLSGITMLIILKVVNILRKLKYRLSRTNLDKLYLVYIRPDLGSITCKCNRLHYKYFAIFMITLHYDYINFQM